MSITLEPSPEVEAFLQAEARRRNKDTTSATVNILEELARAATPPQKTDAHAPLWARASRDEWLAAFHEWVNDPTHRNRPSLPPEAFDRENFYKYHD